MIYVWVMLVLLIMATGYRRIEHRLIFKPTRTHSTTPEKEGLVFEEVSLTTSDGLQLHGWWFPHPEAIGTILHCHGNAENISDRLWLPKDLQPIPVNLLMFDYRGFGISPGRPSAKGSYLDAFAAYDFIRSKHPDETVPPIIVLGQSLGGGIACELAINRPVKGLVLESTYTSIVQMGRRYYPWLLPDLLCGHRFDCISKVSRITVPKLFAHSPMDETIPFDMGETLFAAAAEPKRWFQLEGEHGEESLRQSPGYHDVFRDFVIDALSTDPS